MAFADKVRASVGTQLVNFGETMEEIAPDFARAYDRREGESHTLERVVRVAGIAVKQTGYGIAPELMHSEDTTGTEGNS